MSGDSKIGLQVGGVSRIAPVRKIAGSTAAASSAATPRAATSNPLPVASLIRMAGELADQPVPVDGARVAALRSAIADGSYTANPAKIATSMLQHLQGRTS